MAKGTKSSKGATGARGIFRQLREEHAQISTMMRRLAETEDGDDRRELFDELRRELLAHGKGEEREVYPVFEQFDDTADLVEELREDHGAMEENIERLRAMDADDEEWADAFEDLMHDVLDHVEVEENELFAAAERLIDDVRAQELEHLYLNSKAQLLRQVA